MIKIVVDTEEELNIVRRVLHTEACSHSTCDNPNYSPDCAECIEKYHKDRTVLYKREVVEEQRQLVV